MASINTKSLDILCNICEVGNATSKCIECNENLCKFCTVSHKRSKATRTHKTVSEDVNTWKSSNNKMKEKTKCKFHPKEAITVYCRTCSLFVCGDCTTYVHKKHNHGKIDEIAKPVRDVIFQSLTQVKEKHVSSLKSKLAKTEKYRQEFDLHNKRILESINQRMKELEIAIKNIREKLINEFETLQKDNENVIATIETDLKDQMFQLEKMNDAFTEILNSASGSELLSAERKLQDKLRNTLSNIRFNPVVHLSHFISGNHAIDVLQNAFGFIRRGEDFSSEFEENVDNNKLPFNCKIEAAFNHKRGDILSVCPVNQNEAWIHRKNESENDCVDKCGIIRKSAELDFFIDDFACSKNGDVLCSTYGKQSVVLMTNNCSSRTVAKTVPLHPRGICISCNNNILVCLMDDYTYDITDRSKRCVAEISRDGTTVKEIEYSPDGDRLFTVPYRIAENKNRDICVVDRTSDTSGQLLVLNDQGLPKFIYDNDDDRFIPNGVVCDSSGRIIISDFWDRLHILDGDGNLLQYLVSEEHIIEFPQSVGMDSDGCVWIGCEGGNIFIISYNEVNK